MSRTGTVKESLGVGYISSIFNFSLKLRLFSGLLSPKSIAGIGNEGFGFNVNSCGKSIGRPNAFFNSSEKYRLYCNLFLKKISNSEPSLPTNLTYSSLSRGSTPCVNLERSALGYRSRNLFHFSIYQE